MDFAYWLIAYIIVSVLVHELFHKIVFSLYGIKARFTIFRAKSGFPIGLQFLPENYDYKVKQQLVLSLAGFIGPLLVSMAFFFLINYYFATIILIVFPILISVYDLRMIAMFLKSPKEISVSKAFKKKI